MKHIPAESEAYCSCGHRSELSVARIGRNAPISDWKCDAGENFKLTVVHRDRRGR